MSPQAALVVYTPYRQRLDTARPLRYDPSAQGARPDVVLSLGFL